jgi:hypothetical protein
MRFLRTQFNPQTFAFTQFKFLNNIDDVENETHISGITHENPGNLRKNHRYLIEIFVGSKIKYPHKWRYRKSVPPPLVKTELECLVHVLAHRTLSCSDNSWLEKKRLINTKLKLSA